MELDFRGIGWFFLVFFIVFLYGFAKFSIWIAKPSEFVVTKQMKAEKRIVTDGIRVDTVLVYKIK